MGDGFHWVLLLKQKRTHFSVLSLLKKTKHMFVPPQLVELQPAPKLLLNQQARQMCAAASANFSGEGME